jgi:integrase
MATTPPPGNNLPTGIVRTPRGYRAFVRVAPGPGGLKSKCFKPGTGLLTMRRWREEQRVRKNIGADLPEAGRTLREDVAAYLRQVQTMPTIRHRRDDLALWLRAFGPERVRASITSGDIRAQLENWRAEGYAPSTVNHRRTALMHLWSVLDGKSAPNPARDVPRYHEESQDAPPSDLSSDAVAVVFASLQEGPSRAWLELWRRTGWPPAQMRKIELADIDWDVAVYVRRRSKGRGVAGKWLPVLDEAWAALRDLKRLGCIGDGFRTDSLRNAFIRAAERARTRIMLPLSVVAELERVTPYQLRHSFGTLVASSTGDERAVQELLQQSDIRTTRRYTKRSVDPRVAAALDRVKAATQILGADAKP